MNEGWRWTTSEKEEKKKQKCEKRKRRKYVQQISKSHYFNCGYYYFAVLCFVSGRRWCGGGGGGDVRRRSYMLERHFYSARANIRHSLVLCECVRLVVRNAWQPTSINLPCELHYLFVRVSFSSFSSFSFANKYDKMLSRFTISRISSVFACTITPHNHMYRCFKHRFIYYAAAFLTWRNTNEHSRWVQKLSRIWKISPSTTTGATECVHCVPELWKSQ